MDETLAGMAERVVPVLGAAETFALVLDPDGRVVWVNDATVSGFGELPGATILGVVALRLRPVFRRRLEEVAAGRAPAEFDTVVVDRHGNQAAVAVTLDRLERGGQLAGILALLQVPSAPAPGDARPGSLRSAALSLLAEP
jgi:PAS fold